VCGSPPFRTHAAARARGLPRPAATRRPLPNSVATASPHPGANL
jgi:hypothetical protein